MCIILDSKIKKKLLIATPWRQTVGGGVHAHLHASLISVPELGTSSASRPGRFTPIQKTSLTDQKEVSRAPVPLSALFQTAQYLAYVRNL
jgi:hypothetical protein